MSKTVDSCPKGYHTITPSLVVREAAKAIEFYKKAFGAQELMRMPAPGGWIVHAELKIGNSIIMLNDEMPPLARCPQSYGGTPVSFYLYMDDVDAAWKQAVDAGAKPLMPLENRFWGDRLGTLVDPFGHTWSLAQHIADPSPEEMKKGQEAFFAQMKKKQ